MTNNKNIYWQEALVSRLDREEQHQHKSVVLWFTGLSGAGKSTLAHAVEKLLYQGGCSTFVFDGDNVRHGLCSDLGFTEQDRAENIRRMGEMAKLFLEAGVIALTAFISPYINDRNKVRNLMTKGDFIEIYCNCSLEECERRDVKGLYKKARQGEIRNFTGISSPYEPPEHAELVVNTGAHSIEACANQVLEYLIKEKVISK
jgi:adenylylsulfate kinase